MRGAIFGEWQAQGGAQGLLGYPLNNETLTPNNLGKYNHFQNGSIYWTPNTAAHEVHGLIRQKWASLGPHPCRYPDRGPRAQGTIVIPRNARRPDLARQFIDYTLPEAGQAVVAQAFGLTCEATRLSAYLPALFFMIRSWGCR